MKNRSIAFILLTLSVLLAISLACSSGSFMSASAPQADLSGTQASLDKTRVALGAPPTQPGATSEAIQSSPEVIPPTATATSLPPTSEPPPTATAVEAPSQPISLRQGLASLDSYRLKVVTVFNGPTEADKSRTEVEMEVAAGGDQTHTVTSTTSSTAEDPEKTTDRTEDYRIGPTTCTLSGDGSDVEFEVLTPIEKEMMGITDEMIDLLPLITDPVLVGPETVNGTETNHFTFKVSGLGAESGAQVAQNKGEYWLAIDGQYLVKYSLALEMRTGPKDDPKTESMVTRFTYELSDVNTPISFELPSSCK